MLSKRKRCAAVIAVMLVLWASLPARLFAGPELQAGAGISRSSGLVLGIALVALGLVGAAVLIGLVLFNLARGNKPAPLPTPPAPPTQAESKSRSVRPGNPPQAPAWATSPKPPATPPRPTVPPQAAAQDESRPAAPPKTIPEVKRASPAHGAAASTRPVAGIATAPVAAPQVKPPEIRSEKRREDDEYYFVPETDIIKVRGDSRTLVPVHVRVLKGKGEDASRVVTCSIHSSHPDKVCCGPLRSNVQFDVSARHLGVQPFTQGNITVSGTAPNGKPLRDIKLRVEVQPVALKLHLYVWKKGFLAQELTETLEHACAFIDGFVGASRGDSGADEGFDTLAPLPTPAEPLPEQAPVAEVLQRNNLHPVAFAHCRAELRVGDTAWSLARETQSDAAGQFRFAMPVALVRRFGGQDLTAAIAQPAELHLHPELMRGLDALRLQVSFLPNIAALDNVRAECRSYPRQFFRQLCELSSDVYNDLMASLALLRAAVAFAVRYRQDYIDQRPLFKRAMGETFGSIAALALFTNGLLKSCYDWIANRASGWVLAVSAGLKGSQLPRWVFRLVYVPIRILLRAMHKSVRWSLTRGVQKLSEWRVIRMTSFELDEVWERLARQVHDRIWSEYNTGRHPSALETEVGDRIAVGLLGLWEIVAWTIAALGWFLMNGVLWTVAWMMIGACQTLGDQLEMLPFLQTRAGLRQLYIKYVEWDLNAWAKEVGRCVSIIVDAYNRTGEVETGLTRLSGSLMNRIPRVERIDALLATALHLAYIRSRDRQVPQRWQENVRIAAGAQAEFLKAWQASSGWLEFLATVNSWTQLVVKTVVQAAALGIAHAMDKTEGLVIQGMSRFAIKSADAYTRVRAEPFAKAAELPGRASDLLQAFVYARIALKEYMQLLAIKEGLPSVIAVLYDSELDQVTGANYNPTPEEGEEEPAPLRPPDPAASAARLARLVSGTSGEPPSPPAAQVTVGVGDVDVLKRVRDFLAQGESPEDEDKRIRQEAVAYAEQVIRESGVRWTREQRQTLIESRIKTLQIKKLLSSTDRPRASEEQPLVGGRS